MKKSQLIFSIIGMVVGIAAIVIGVLFWAGVFNWSHFPSVTGSDFDYGYTNFASGYYYGSNEAKYYTYSNNNAAYAGENAYTAAVNTYETAELLGIVGGAITAFFGLFMICFFGMQLGKGNIASSPTDSPSPVQNTPDTPQKVDSSKSNFVKDNAVERNVMSSGNPSAHEELLKLKSLYDNGIISQEVYELKKAKYTDML